MQWIVFTLVTTWIAFGIRSLSRNLHGGGAGDAKNTAKNRDKNTENPALKAQDMVLCRQCGVFVVKKNASACGRETCPYPEKKA